MAVPRTVKAHLAIASVQLSYAIYQVISKAALSQGVNQVVFCAYRDLIAVTILAAAAFIFERGQSIQLTRHLLLYFLILGLTGVFANQLLFLLGLDFTSPAFTAAFQPGIPVFTFILTVCLGSQRIDWRHWSGLAKVGGTVICILGAIFMAVYKGPVILSGGLNGINIPKENLNMLALDQFEQGLSSLHLSLWDLGTLCLVGNCFFMSIYLCVQAHVLKTYHAAISLTAYAYFFGVTFIILVGLLSQTDWHDWILTKLEFLAVCFAGVVASAINYGLLTWSNKVLGPAIVALYVPLQPVFSSILSWVFLSSTLYVGSIIGAIGIVAGLYLVTLGQMRSGEPVDFNDDKRGTSPDVEDTFSHGGLNDSLLKD